MDDFQLVDEIRALTGNPLPPSEAREQAHTALLVAISAESAAPQRQALRFRIATATALVALTLLGLFIFSRPNRVHAVLLELAEATRAIPVAELTSDDALYTSALYRTVAVVPGEDLGLNASHVAYLLPYSEETWTREDAVLVRTTVGDPEFFASEVAAAYTAANYATRDRVGATTETAYDGETDPIAGQDWPADPDALLQAIDSWIQTSNHTPTDSVRVQVAAKLVRLRATSPELRAATLTVLASLPVQVHTTDKTIIVTITYDEDGTRHSLALTFDTDGYLRSETLTTIDGFPDLGIPADTAIFDATYTPPAATPPGITP